MQTLVKNHVPADFTELFGHYYDYVVRLVKKAGIEPQNAEDVAMTILSKFYEKDALSDYDPTRTREINGVARTTQFSTFLSGFVLVYVQHYRDRQNVTKWREVLKVDSTVTVGGPDGAEKNWLDVQGHVTRDDHDDLLLQDLAASITAHLKTREGTGRARRVALTDFFSRLMVEVTVDARINVARLAEEYQVSPQAVYKWLDTLRAEIDIVLAEQE